MAEPGTARRGARVAGSRAEIVSVSPEPEQRFEVDGVPFVLWRRYYAAGEETLLEVVFRTAGS